MGVLDTGLSVLAVDAVVVAELEFVKSVLIPVTRLGLKVVVVVLGVILGSILLCSSILVRGLCVEL